MSRLRPPRSRPARARIALALCVLWIAGFELMPWMHVALHGHLAAHHHATDGSIVLGADSHHDDRDAEVDEHGNAIRRDLDADVDPSHRDLDAEVDEHGNASHRDLDAEVDEHGNASRHDCDAYCNAKHVDTEVDEHAADHILDDDRDVVVDEHASDRDTTIHEHADSHPSIHDHQGHLAAFKAARHPDGRTRLADALAHGQHSLAHHGIAVPAPAPAITQPLPVDRRATFVVAVAILEPISLIHARAVARGPPNDPS
ncbi:MAG: hypothetical protein JWO36_6452 [Myxococcales bacterium]|nr:hypothetical protein [Myxococcales bacterium]